MSEWTVIRNSLALATWCPGAHNTLCDKLRGHAFDRGCMQPRDRSGPSIMGAARLHTGLPYLPAHPPACHFGQHAHEEHTPKACTRRPGSSAHLLCACAVPLPTCVHGVQKVLQLPEVLAAKEQVPVGLAAVLDGPGHVAVLEPPRSLVLAQSVQQLHSKPHLNSTTQQQTAGRHWREKVFYTQTHSRQYCAPQQAAASAAVRALRFGPRRQVQQAVGMRR